MVPQISLDFGSKKFIFYKKFTFTKNDQNLVSTPSMISFTKCIYQPRLRILLFSQQGSYSHTSHYLMKHKTQHYLPPVTWNQLVVIYLEPRYLGPSQTPHHTCTVLCFNIQAQANIQGPQCTSLLNVSQGSPTSPKCRCLMLGIPHRTGDLSIHFSRDLQPGFIVEHFTRYLHALF